MQRGAIFDFNGTMVLDGQFQELAWRTWAREHLGLELSDEMLDAVAGGSIPGWMSPCTSASCGNYDVIR